MKIKFYLTCIFLSVIFLTNLRGQDWINTAKGKEKEGKYQEAAILYERVLFLNTDSSNFVNIAITGEIHCLKKEKKFPEVINFIKKNLQLVSSDSVKYRVYEQWITCAYLSEQLNEALSIIEQSQLLFPQYCNKQWLTYFKILCLNELNDWSAARDIYKSWLLGYGMDTTLADIYNLVPTLKSEDKASWLSTFIPGGGQLYAGKPIEALTSFFIQGLGIYYGIKCVETQYYLSAWLVGAGVFGSFHFGGVRRSVELVKEYNRKKTIAFNEILREKITGQLQSHL